ncbi:MAG: hypothetical protein OXD46_11870 [Chloroflexi bacterium]|nr:hypothetical protein [Chloroflexota bacterium]
MSTLAEIQQAIISIPKSDYAQLIRWLREYDWEEWDREIEEDVRVGKLDALAAEAWEAKAKGELREL